ncbi:MAG TPA: universal stress protein [Acidimicrobiales bacterium]|nr:universal stress protein [Acidimicrobiales bacterium]
MVVDASHPIVVGIDGSGGSYEALEWAATYAEETGRAVVAICAWEYPASYGFYVGADVWDLGATSRVMAEEQVAKVQEQHPAARIDLQVVEGHPGQILVEASEDAALLVVGCRGRGGFIGMLVGSTSTHCVHAAACPVLVYR